MCVGILTSEKEIPQLLAEFETLLELVYTSACIDELLLTGEERVALGANFNSHIALSRLSHNSLAASALYCNFLVFGMDSFLHFMNTSQFLLQFLYAMIHTP